MAVLASTQPAQLLPEYDRSQPRHHERTAEST
jgi:hypothetical protein